MSSISNITIDIRTAEMLGTMLDTLANYPALPGKDAFAQGEVCMAYKHRIPSIPKEVQDDLNLLIKLRA